MSVQQIRERSESSETRCADPEAEKKMIEAIDAARAQGDTLGGVLEVVAMGVPIGLGSHVQWDRKLDANIARALMSIQGDQRRRDGSGVRDSAPFRVAGAR